MFVIGNILHGIADVLDVVLTIYMWVIIIRALLSWVNPDPYNPIVQILNRLTEPVLRPLRKLAPPWKIGIDVSPFIALLIIIFLYLALIKTFYSLAKSMS